jgi:hypothetical protein
MSNPLMIALLLLGFSVSLAGQRTFSFNAYLPVTFTTDRSTTFSGSLEIRMEARDWRVGAPALGYSWLSQRGHFWEVILSDLRISGQQRSTELVGVGIIDGGQATTSSLQVYLLRDLGLWVSRNDQWSAQLGVGLGPFFQSTDFVPRTSAGFPFHEFDLGTQVVAMPRLRRSLGSSVLLELSAFLTVLDAYYTWAASEDPLLTIDQQRTNSYTLEMLPAQFALQLGIRYYWYE